MFCGVEKTAHKAFYFFLDKTMLLNAIKGVLLSSSSCGYFFMENGMKRTRLLTTAFCLLALAAPTPSLAQEVATLPQIKSAHQQTHITGRIIDSKDNTPLIYAFLRLMPDTKDTISLATAQTDQEGRFLISTKQVGKLRLNINYLGYESRDVRIELTQQSDSLHLSSIALKPLDNSLRTALVTTYAAQMQQKGDTTVFNAAAFRTPEGSALQALIAKLPGATVGSDGTVKVNGKVVKEFLVNGKDFFKGDNKVALENLPTNLVSQLKTYDKKSDYTEQTGIDDGEETFVMDVITKREFNESFVSNFDFSGGWDYDNQRTLYASKIFATRFTDRSRLSFFASNNNTGGGSFGDGRGWSESESENGQNTLNTLGIDFNWSNGKKRFSPKAFEIGGAAFFKHNDNSTQSLSATQNFVVATTNAVASYANAKNLNHSFSRSFGAHLRIRWNVDSLTFLTINPSWNWEKNQSAKTTQSATFEQDPFEAYALASTPEVLEYAFTRAQKVNQTLRQSTDNFLVNLNEQQHRTQNSSHTGRVGFFLLRRLASNGRHFDVKGDLSYTTTENHAWTRTDLFVRQNSTGSLNNLQSQGAHQFNESPSTAWSYGLGSRYTEPITKRLNASVDYKYEFQYRNNDRTLYQLISTNGFATLADLIASNSNYATLTHLYSQGSESLWKNVASTQLLSALSSADLYAALRDAANSQYATYNHHLHKISFMLNYRTKELRWTVGLSLNPERSFLQYERPALGKFSESRTVFNLAPQLRLNYKMNNNRRLDFNYRGNSSQPSMTQMLHVVDHSDPQNITMGNVGLRPSWRDALHLEYNDYQSEKTQNIAIDANFQNTRNAVSTRLIYDRSSGRNFTRPENVNGNWDASLNIIYGRALDSSKRWNLHSVTTSSFTRSVGYVSTATDLSHITLAPTAEQVAQLFTMTSSQRNVSKDLHLGEQLTVEYRRSLWDVMVFGAVNYQRTVATLDNINPLNTWTMEYGTMANLSLDNGLAISTDLTMRSRRGFLASAFNTNELIWNIQIAQSFLAKKTLTLSVQFYDLLRQKSNISRTITALQRRDVWHNSLNAYAMLHLVYKLNIFPNGVNPMEYTREGGFEAPPPPQQGDRSGQGDRPPFQHGGSPMGPFF